MYFIGYGCSFIDGTASFRTAWGIQFVPCIFLMIGLPFLPESPRWLAKVDRSEEAINVLAKIQAGGNVNDPLVVAEWEEITETLAAERMAPKSWRKFVYNGMWKRTLAGFTVQMWQQNSGANVMVPHPHLQLFRYKCADFYRPMCGLSLDCEVVSLTNTVRGLHFHDGGPSGQYQPDRLRSPVRTLYHLHDCYVLLRKYPPFSLNMSQVDWSSRVRNLDFGKGHSAESLAEPRDHDFSLLELSFFLFTPPSTLLAPKESFEPTLQGRFG
jgi:Sugar (and other) transporter